MANEDGPATKRDVGTLRSEVHHVYDALVDRIADSETKLLEAFYTLAESNQTRLAGIEKESETAKKRRRYSRRTGASIGAQD